MELPLGHYGRFVVFGTTGKRFTFLSITTTLYCTHVKHALSVCVGLVFVCLVLGMANILLHFITIYGDHVLF